MSLLLLLRGGGPATYNKTGVAAAAAAATGAKVRTTAATHTKTGGAAAAAAGAGTQQVQTLPSVATLTDAFTGGSLSGLWTASSGVALTGTGQLEQTQTAPGTPGYADITSASPYRLRGAAVYLDLKRPAGASGATSYETMLKVTDGSGRIAEWVVYGDGTSLLSRHWTSGVDTYHEFGTWDPAAMRYLRIAEAAGVATFATSPDASTWTTFATADLTAAWGDGWQDAVWVVVTSGHWATETAASPPALFEGVNVVGPSAATYSKAGTAAPATAAAGAKVRTTAATWTKAGRAAAAAAASGTKTVVVPQALAKSGTAAASAASSGVKVLTSSQVRVKTGTAAAGEAAAGAKTATSAQVRAAAGTAAAGTAAAGTKVRTTAGASVKTGAAAAGPAASGMKVRLGQAARDDIHVGAAFAVIDATTAEELATAKAAGCTHALVQVFWDQCQSTAGGAVNAAGTLANLSRITAAGMKAVLRVSIQYPPQFVQDNTPPLKDEAGNLYTPGNITGNNVRDWIWSATGRGYVDDFLTKLFVQLPWTQIERVQLGGGPAGELKFPDSTGTHWWGYGTAAQTGTGLAAGMAACPVPGHVVSATPTWTANDQAFLTWYEDSLVKWMLWLIAKHRDYFSGPVYVMHPGAGLRPNSQTPTSTEQGGNYRANMAAGLDWHRQIAAYPGPLVRPYSTWLNADHFWPPDPYNDTFDGNASPWYHLKRVAARYGRAGALWGENSGQPAEPNSKMDEMFTGADGAMAHGYRGMMWLHHDSLSSGTSATYANFAARIAEVPRPRPYRRGVSMAGGEFSPSNTTLPGVYGTDYSYDSATALANVGARGHNLHRLPVRWERGQPTRMAALDSTETARWTTQVTNAAAAGMKTRIDVHNYGRYIVAGGATLVLGDTLTTAEMVDLWVRISNLYKNNPNVDYALMNEPHDLPGTGGAFSGTVLYDWSDGTVQGWTGDSAGFVHSGGQGRMSGTATAGYWNMRKDDAGTLRNNSATGTTVRVKATLGASVTGADWKVIPQWQNQSFQWVNPTSTTYTRVDNGQAVTGLIAGVPVYVDATFSSIVSQRAWCLQVESNTATGGQVVVVDFDDFSRGTAGAGGSGAATWEAASQAMVTAIRNNGDHNHICVGGYGWSSARWWPDNHPVPWIVDPDNNFSYEAHYYGDADNSGDYPDSYATENAAAVAAGYGNLAARCVDELSNFTDWCATHDVIGFIGEIGWPNTGDTAGWNAVGDALYDLLDTAEMDVAAWAGGARWGTGYNLSLYRGEDQATVLSAALVVEAHPPAPATAVEYAKAGTAAAAAAATGAKVRTSAQTRTKAGTAAAAAAGRGTRVVTSGWRYAGSGQSRSGPWQDVPNAVGPTQGDTATWTSTGGVAVLELAGFGLEQVVGAGSVVQFLALRVRTSVSNVGDLASLTAQCYVGATPVGGAQALVLDPASHEDTVTVSGVAYEDLADLRVRITATGQGGGGGFGSTPFGSTPFGSD